MLQIHFLCSFYRIGCHGNYRCSFILMIHSLHFFKGGNAIHIRHHLIHENKVIMLLFHQSQTFFSAACHIHDCTGLQQHLFCHNAVHFHIVYHKDMRAGKLGYRHHSTDRKLIVFENLLHITNAIFADDLLRYDCRKY